MHNSYNGMHVHFIGIGGIGVSAIAQMIASEGGIITGSDLHPWDPRSVPEGTYALGHKPENIPPQTNLVVYSDAAQESNPERIAAKERGIPQKSFAQMLGEMTKHHTTTAVSGTHGKSTTTALLGLLSKEDDATTNVFVGAILKEWSSNVYLGKGQRFIVEADEYREHMMELTPKIIVLTNLELDHPDYYRDTVHLMSVFSGYVRKIEKEGTVVANIDDHNVRHVLNGYSGNIISFSMVDPKADLFLRAGTRHDHSVSLEIFWKNDLIAKTTTTLPGDYNMANIAAACAGFMAAGGNPTMITRIVPQFTGIGRRFEVVGIKNGTTIISDYAHHPTALRGVAKAATEYFEGKRVLFVFRPHQQERTKTLFNEYKKVIEHISDLILIEIYDVVGRGSNDPISSRSLLDQESDWKTYAKDLDTAEKLIRERMSQYDVVVVIGAGDADKLATKLVA